MGDGDFDIYEYSVSDDNSILSMWSVDYVCMYVKQCIKMYINKAVQLLKAQICISFCQNLNKLLFCQETR